MAVCLKFVTPKWGLVGDCYIDTCVLLSIVVYSGMIIYLVSTSNSLSRGLICIFIIGVVLALENILFLLMSIAAIIERVMTKFYIVL